MAESQESDNQRKRLSTWEEQCLLETDEQNCIKESNLQRYQKSTDVKLWTHFQNTASAIAQLYKDRLQDEDCVWHPFQTSAVTATNLYKDSIDACQHSSDLAVQCGIQRRNKEFMSWLKKKNRMIRRDELIGFISGRPTPYKTVSPQRTLSSPVVSYYEPAQDMIRINSSDNLQEFQEAVAIAGLHGAMSRVSVHSKGNSPQHNTSNGSRYRDLTTFIRDEVQRRKNDCPSTSKKHQDNNSTRKRHTSPPSPDPELRKRSRY